LTSDHGESLGEHDYYFEHGWYAYEPGLRIPLLVKLPGQATGRVVDAQVSTLDLAPTLLGLAGLPRDAVGAEGSDLRQGAPAEAPVLIESSDRYPEKYHGARSARWKYLRREGDGREELYDLAEDPAELANLAQQQPERREELAAFVARRRAELARRAFTPGSAAPDDADTRERLRALGYVE
jgi:choline-sulfatase